MARMESPTASSPAQPPSLSQRKDSVLQRRLELAAGGIPIGITNPAGAAGDKCAHYEALPGGPSAKFPDRPKGPGPNDRGAQYYATTDPAKIHEWSLKYPGCNTFIGGFLPEDVACLDIDRFEEFSRCCPGLFEALQAAGHPIDKRVGRDRYHIWVRGPVDCDIRRLLPFRCTWGEIKWRGGLVVSSPSQTYDSVVPLRSWEQVPRLSQSQIDVIVASKATSNAPRGLQTYVALGRHPKLLALSARLASQFHPREYIIDAVMAADRDDPSPAQYDEGRPGDFAAEVERMVDGAISKFGIGQYKSDGTVSTEPRSHPEPGPLPSHLLDVGGLAGNIADHINSQATISNHELAFLAGLVAVAHACGRHITTQSNLAPGIGIVALAPSASGKEKPQAVLGEIFSRAEMSATIVRNIASGQGLEDWLGRHAKLLLMVDEAMHLFRDMANPKQAPFSPEHILKELLSGKDYYTGRVVAKLKGKLQEPVNVIRPHITLYGSAVPSEFFETINPSMIGGGLFGRLLCPVITPGPLVSPAPATAPVPDRIIEQVRHWQTLDFSEGAEANKPRIVPFEPHASDAWEAYRNAGYQKAQASEDELRRTLWSRSAEKAGRLALIRAASRDRTSVASIRHEDVDWACAVVDHYTNQLIFKASQSISTNDTERRRNAFLAAIRKYMELHPGESRAPHSFVSRYSKIDGQNCRQIAYDLVECEMLQIHTESPRANGVRPAFYEILDPDSPIHTRDHEPAVKQDSAPNAQRKGRKRGIGHQ